MDKKPLVINEAVASGSTRIEFHGNRTKAISHIYDGRKQLGGMRAMYNVNERIASGQPGGFYSMINELGDGTRIQTVTNDGQDKIVIIAPPDPVPEPEKKVEELEYEDIVIAGTCYDYEAFTTRAVIWYGTDAPALDLGPPLEGWTSTSANAISDDGDTVVGVCHHTYSYRYGAAFRWTKAEGIVDLGMPDIGIGDMAAHAVNEDGTVIVGVGNMVGGMAPWMWKKDEGFRVLSTLGMGISQSVTRMCVSPNGRYIAGMVVSPEATDNVAFEGAYWFDGEGPNLIPRSGQISILYLDGGSPEHPFGDWSRPFNVTDDGIIIGTTNHGEQTTRPFSVTHPDDPDGSSDSFGTTYLRVYPDTNTVFRWDAVNGGFDIIGDHTPASAADDAETTVVGTKLTDQIVPYQNVVVGGEPPVRAVYNGYNSENKQTTGWKLEKTENQTILTMFDTDTEANDVSEDGTITVGCTKSYENGNFGRAKMPVWWNEENTMEELALLEGFPYAEATAVTVVVSKITFNP